MALHIRWLKYWSFGLSISPSNEYSGLISFRIDWFYLFAVQDSQDSSPTPQFKSSILWCTTFFIFLLSHPYVTGKTIALTNQTFVGKVMSLLFNMQSRFVIAFLPRSKYLLISWLVTIHSDFGAQKDKVSHCFHCFPIYLPGSDGTRRKVMINLDSIFKSRDITLPTKVYLVKAMIFPVVMYGCESWTIKKAEHRRIDISELWCWRRLLKVPWTARRSNQSIPKEISLNIHWKD